MALRRPRLALPFAVLQQPGVVRLVAGEDHRYTLSAPGLDAWLPALLDRMDGRRDLPALLAAVPEPERAAAARLIDRLYGERLLFDGAPEDGGAAAGARRRLRLSGAGPLLQALRGAEERDGAEDSGGAEERGGAGRLPVLCQDRLDLAQALRWNRACLAGAEPFLWVSCAALGRGYVSPVFLPGVGSGPCLGCLLGGFQRLSSVPELYADLLAHSERGGALPPAPFPAPAAAMLAQLARWKRDLLAEPRPPAALFRLHVLEVATLSVESHALLPDPECPDCGGAP